MKARSFGRLPHWKNLVQHADGNFEVHDVGGIPHYVRHSIGKPPKKNRWAEVEET